MAEVKSGFEPSEIFTATAMFFTKAELNKIQKGDLFQVVEFFKDTEEKLTNSEGGVVFGSSQEQSAFESNWDWTGKSEGNSFPDG